MISSRLSLLSSALAALCLLAVEATLYFQYLAHAVSLSSFIAIHVLLTVLLCMWSYRSSSQWVILLTLLYGCLGPYGSAGFLIVLFFLQLHRWRTASTENQLDQLAFLFPEYEPSRSKRLFENIRDHHEELDEIGEIVPFQDVMELGNVRQKQMVLAKMARKFSAHFASVLRKGLEDPHNVIRVQTASLIAKVENDFHCRFLELQSTQKKKPNDPRIHKKIAQYYDERAFCGLFDEEEQQKNQKQAIEAYEKYLDHKPQDYHAALALSRLYLRQTQLDKAENLLRQHLQASEVPSQPHVLWLMETLFEQRKFAELREVATSHQTLFSGKTEGRHPSYEIAGLWMSS